MQIPGAGGAIWVAYQQDGDRAVLRIQGHTHDSFDYEIYGTRVVCNPRGYAPRDLNPEFRADLIVNI